jgi:hypothetical protein
MHAFCGSLRNYSAFRTDSNNQDASECPDNTVAITDLAERLRGGRFEGKNPSLVEASTRVRLSFYSGIYIKTR